MKLSAPPPPPEPNEPGDGQSGADTPATPAPHEAFAPAPPAPPPATDASKQATWPTWFPGADFTLAFLVLILAFLVASFAARNSDVWLHLAAGKRLYDREYTPGSDPFSFAAADRTWVNHSILFDLGLYLLYSGTGTALVALKALFVAATFGLLIAVRRPGFPLWPWAAVAAVGVVAAAPYLQLRPTIGSLFLLSVTLFLLFRMPHKPDSWRFPAAIGATFWLWANVDEWFILGPLALGLVLAGELLQGKLAKGGEGAEEPLGPLPDVRTLAKALGVGVLACMLNPHHVGVWQLPFELTGARDVAGDIRFKQLLLTPLDQLYTSSPTLGYNHNGLAYALLFVGGGAALGLAATRVRVSHVALWMGFALLSLMSIYAIPFLAVVGVPLVAGQLNATSRRVSLKSWGDPKTRFLLLGSAVGRMASLALALAACVLAWPGWVQPPSSNPAFARRVAWSVEPDAGMRKGAEQLQAWRQDGRLPDDVHGVCVSVELANYCAWFAPLEKVYANGRFNHHRPEWPDYLAVRVGMQLVAVDERPDPKLLSDALARVGADYVAIHAGPGDNNQLRDQCRRATEGQWSAPDRWSPWYLDGRTTVSGWRPAPGKGKPTFAALRVDPVALAFGPGVVPTVVPPRRPIRRGESWADAFVWAPPVPSPWVDESMAWHTYAEFEKQLAFRRQIFAALTDGVCRLPAVFSSLASQLQAADEMRAASFLALRAARRAVADDPDNPDGYFTLFLALDAPDMALSPPERSVAQVAALRQCLDRMPSPKEYRPGIHVASPTKIATGLAQLYLGRRQEFRGVVAGVSLPPQAFEVLTFLGATGYVVTEGDRIGRVPAAALRGVQVDTASGPYLLPLDLARETMQLAQQYAEREFADPEQRSRELAFLEGEQKVFAAELARQKNVYENQRAGKKVREQVVLALSLNLAGEALAMLSAKDLDPAREFGEEAADFMLCRAALELATGQIEAADDTLELLSSNAAFQRRMSEPALLGVFRGLAYQKLLMEGNYAEGGKVMEEREGAAVRHDRNAPARQQFDTKPFTQSANSLLSWRLAQFTALLAPNALDLTSRLAAPVAGLTGYRYRVSPNPAQDVIVPGFASFQDVLVGYRNARADFFFRRGLLFLLEGNVEEAERKFQQTRQEAVKDWGLREGFHPGAKAYLDLIDAARKRAAKP